MSGFLYPPPDIRQPVVIVEDGGVIVRRTGAATAAPGRPVDLMARTIVRVATLPMAFVGRFMRGLNRQHKRSAGGVVD